MCLSPQGTYNREERKPFFSPLSLSLCLFLMLLMERDGIFYFNMFFSEQQKLTKNMLSHLREVNTVWKQPASARSFFSCHSQLSQSPWWEDFTLLLQSSLVNNCCHPKVKNLKTAILCHFPYKRLLSSLVASPLFLGLQYVPSIVFLENCVKQLNGCNDEYVLLGLLGDSIRGERFACLFSFSIKQFCAPSYPIRVSKYD